MRAIARWTLVAGVVVSASTADWTGAQAPEGARLLSAQAIGESLAVLRKLQDSVARHYRNPAAWYHQGMIAAALYDRCRVAPRLSILDCTRPRPLADSAFMIARELEPENREYVLALGRFLLAADVVFWRDATYFKRLFDASLSAAKKTGNPVTYADATLDLGQYYWLEYDAKAHRDFETAKPDDVRVLAAESGASQTRSPITVVGSRGGGTTREAMTAARNSLNAKNEDPTQGFSGEIEYLLSEMLFREAFEAAPGYVRAYRAYETLLAERNRWSEVGAVSRERMRAVPDDGWAWMTAAMATYRAGNASGAIAAFDTAMRVLSPSERARVQSLDRVLGLAQRTRFDALQDTAQAREERLYWLVADPLWSRKDTRAHVEFLARVTYAELVWTLDALNQHGSESDRGEVYIRMGPPDRISSTRGDNPTGMPDMMSGAMAGGRPAFPIPPGGHEPKAAAGATPPCPPSPWSNGKTTFEYDFARLSFTFPRVPQPRCRQFYEDSVAHTNMSARWDNLVAGRVDSMPTQLARFRGWRDSTDVVFAALMPVDEVRRATDVATRVRSDFWILSDDARTVRRDSLVPAAAGIATMTARLAPGSYLYRTETTAEGSMVAGRASARFVAGPDPRTGFALTGFGMSDVLLATRAEPLAGVAERWSDLDLSPLAGGFARDQQLSVVWENYEFANDHGSVRFGVTITLRAEHPDTSNTSSIAARIIGGIANAIGVERQVQPDRVTFAFDRTLPYARVLLDRITLSLETTPPGAYVLTLDVVDRVTRQTTGRSQRIVIVK